MIVRQIPNFITLMNLLAGLLSVFFCLQHDLLTASLLVYAAAVFDFLDGLAARLLNSYSEFGRELDSFADLVSFGVAPAVMIHLLMTVNSPEAGGSEKVFYRVLSYLPSLLALFAAIRLARFNLKESGEAGFRGLPSPAGGIFFASLAMLSTVEGTWIPSLVFTPGSLALLVILFSLLMVSRIPTLSFKFSNLAWKGNEFRYVMLGISLILLFLLRFSAVPVLIAVYLVLSLASALIKNHK